MCNFWRFSWDSVAPDLIQSNLAKSSINYILPSVFISESDPNKEYSLHKLNILCRVNKDNVPVSWWKKRKNSKLVQVDELGGPMYSGDENKEKTIPNESSLKVSSPAGSCYF